MIHGKRWLKNWVNCGLGVLTCLLPCVSGAQEAKPTENKKPKKEVPPGAAAHMSVVALGSIPTRRYKMPDDDDLEDIDSSEGGADVDGADDSGNDKTQPSTPGGNGKRTRPARDSGAGDIPILLPLLPGSVPPSTLFYKLPKAPKDGNPWGRMRVGFNNATSVTKVHAGVPLDLHYIDRERNSGYHSYLKLPPLKPWSQVVVFLTPSKDTKTPWKSEPNMSVLNMRSSALRDKNVLVKNFSNEAVAFVVGDHPAVTLEPGQRKSFAIPRKVGYYRVAAVKLNGKVPLLHTSVRLPAKTLSLFAFYNANARTNGGKNVGAFRTTLSKVSPAELAKKMTVPKL